MVQPASCWLHHLGAWLCCCAAGDILVFLTGQAEIDKAVAKLNTAVCSLPEGSAGDLLVLPLYAALPPELQLRVFRPPQPGVRRCIVATNVAETSITVEGVVYVVDSGVMKLKSYNAGTGMDSLEVVAISRVQAAQRAGRAGRTRPGKVSVGVSAGLKMLAVIALLSASAGAESDREECWS
jgi:ATP-dependent RNA helicase DHX8/PRP22